MQRYRKRYLIISVSGISPNLLKSFSHVSTQLSLLLDALFSIASGCRILSLHSSPKAAGLLNATVIKLKRLSLVFHLISEPVLSIWTVVLTVVLENYLNAKLDLQAELCST